MVGLGKLGAPLAATLAASGVTVAGCDRDREIVRALALGRPPIVEPGLEEMLARGRERLTATTDTEAAVADSDLTFIIVPTPSERSGRFSLRMLEEALRSVGRAIASKQARHVVVITSTVMPGDSDGPLRQVLELATGRSCGETLGLCYSPEFIALGRAIEGLRRPDFLLIGTHQAWAGAVLSELYKQMVENDPPIATTTPVNAELVKLSVNSLVTARLSFANMLAEICGGIPGAEVDIVTAAVGLDKRIGPHYLKGAVSFGGPCFPRDNRALRWVAKQVNVDPIVSEATDAMNRRHDRYLADLIEREMPCRGTLGILGLSYTVGTPVFEASAGVRLAREMVRRGWQVAGYDPLVKAATSEFPPASFVLAPSAEDCIHGSDVVVVMTPCPEFAMLRFDDRKGATTVIDCWRLLPEAAVSGSGRRLIRLGDGPRDATGQEP